MKKFVLLFALPLILQLSAQAQPLPLGDLIRDSDSGSDAPVAADIRPVAPLKLERQQYYSANEFSIDLFGQYDADTAGSLFDTKLKGGDWAFGIGANYFFTEYFGAGFDLFCLEPGANREAQPGPGGKQLIKQVSLSAIARYPLGRFAPYVTGGGGYNIHESEITTHAGAGVELRIHNGLGVFGEARHMWTLDGSAPDELQFRMGFRVAKWK